MKFALLMGGLPYLFGRRRSFNNTLKVLGGLGLGAGLMYMLDPQGGGRRRALVVDKFLGAGHKIGDAADTTARDFGNKMRGIFSEVGSFFRKDEVDDLVLSERVRAKLGRLVTHPRAIDVNVDNGIVTLRGNILANEVSGLVSGVGRVRGVVDVKNRLTVHEQAGDVPDLQGSGHRLGSRFELFQYNWSPTMRLLMGAAGGSMTFYGIKRRDLIGALLGTVGTGLLARSITNVDLTSKVKGLTEREQNAEYYRDKNVKPSDKEQRERPKTRTATSGGF